MKMKFIVIACLLVMASCAKIEKQTITIDTNPQGAKIAIAEKYEITGEIVKQDLGLSPVNYEFIPQKKRKYNSPYQDDNHSMNNVQASSRIVEPKYIVYASKEGYFSEKKPITDFDQISKTRKFEVRLEKSPLWWDTTTSNASNQWVNLIVNSDISDVDMWQRVVDAVTKRFPELKEYDFTSGYLVTVPKTKIYKTSRGPFLLQSKFIATVMERDPLTYRLKLISQWSNREGNKWSPYPRVFKEDAALVKELMSRFQAY